MIYNDLLVDNSHRYANLVNQQREDVPSSATSCFFFTVCHDEHHFGLVGPLCHLIQRHLSLVAKGQILSDVRLLLAKMMDFQFARVDRAFFFDPSIADGREIHTHTNLDKSYHYRLQSL